MKLTLPMLCGVLMLFGAPAWAAQPTNINYSGKGSTFTGSDYRVYTVRCSDGKKREITSWVDNRKWCIGKGSSSNCHGSQLKAATTACK